MRASPRNANAVFWEAILLLLLAWFLGRGRLVPGCSWGGIDSQKVGGMFLQPNGSLVFWSVNQPPLDHKWDTFPESSFVTKDGPPPLCCDDPSARISRGFIQDSHILSIRDAFGAHNYDITTPGWRLTLGGLLPLLFGICTVVSLLILVFYLPRFGGSTGTANGGHRPLRILIGCGQQFLALILVGAGAVSILVLILLLGTWAFGEHTVFDVWAVGPSWSIGANSSRGQVQAWTLQTSVSSQVPFDSYGLEGGGEPLTTTELWETTSSSTRFGSLHAWSLATAWGDPENDARYPQPPLSIGPRVAWEIKFRCWIAVVLIAFVSLPCGLLFRRHSRKKGRRPQLCSNCGYDLRASPGRCPECGTVSGERKSVAL